MKIRLIILAFILISTLYLTSCGTSTGSRYQQENGNNGKEKEKIAPTKNKYPENFDLTNYHAKISVNSKNNSKENNLSDVWYEYNSAPNKSDSSKVVIKTIQGYRVQVLTTDNLEEANQMRSDIYFKTKLSAIYIVFNPPFYKVEVGDFKNIDDAKNMSFQLK
ncbi:MAG: SPOR domain-containing protein, partial [Bacteroidetes bacterium]|nr:SPOR domain-containing protein [Bacteroidota bacterium]